MSRESGPDGPSARRVRGSRFGRLSWNHHEDVGRVRIGLLPHEVVRKKPSADLWPGQTDEDELGFGYAVADEVLYLMFDLGLTPEEVVDRGYPAKVVQKIDRLERLNRFKRRLMLIARLSGSAINLDREIPRD